ncbi:MAG: hypothetical protein PF442_02060 [Desulfobulbaceae bacterium]|jgi:tetratricopeptide (TPR) repeat protein|nr:hypothetical protein [Desulfobulbaceae bacterium]
MVKNSTGTFIHYCVLALLLLLPIQAHSGEETATPQEQYAQEVMHLARELAKDPQDPTLLYNYGTGLYKAGKYKQAAETFTKSSQVEQDRLKRAEAKYNQGRSLFAQAEQTRAINGTKPLLQQAGAAFQQALEDNPKLSHARRGLKEYRQAFKKIEQEPQQQQESEKNQEGQKGQDGQDGQDGQENIQEQLDQASKSQQEMNKKNGSTQGESASQGDMNKMADEQEALRKQLEALQEKLAEDPETAKQEESLQKAIDAQKKAEESLRKGQAAEAGKHQNKAEEELQKTGQDDSETGEDSAPQETAEPEAPEEKEVEAATPGANATTLADEILENERLLHELRRRQMRKTRPHQGKDW